MAESESVGTMFQNSFIKNADGDYALKTTAGTAGGGAVKIDATQNTVKLDQTGANNGTQTILPVAARISSIVANGKVTTPAAAAALATTAALSTGTWDIEVTAFITGTTASVDIDNIKLTQNSNPLGVVVVPINGVTGATSNGKLRNRVQVGVSAPVIASAVALATTGAIYAVSITATKVV